MKTAEQIIDENIIEYIWETNLDNIPISKVVEVMKIYAKGVAQQALKDAYINSELEYTPSRYPYGGETVTIDKDSIVNTPIVTP